MKKIKKEYRIDDTMMTEQEFKNFAPDVFLISAVTKEGLNELLHFISEKVDEIPKPEFDLIVEEDLDAYNNDDSEFEVTKIAKDAEVEGIQ